jgi:hypothetical protein
LIAYEANSGVHVQAYAPVVGVPQAVSSGLTDGSPNIVADSSGRAFVAWCAFGSDAGGIYVQQLDPATAVSLGAPSVMPGSLAAYQGHHYSTCVLQTEVSRRIPLAATGHGVYLAGSGGYPALTSVNVWKLGGRSLRVQAGVTNREPQLTADAGNRLWVGWIEGSSTGATIVVRRSNRTATVFGSPVRISAPSGWLVGTFEASATTTHLDLLAQLTRVSNANSLQHTIVLPGLTLVRERTRRLAHGKVAITFRALDAGDPVAGARISAGGTHSRTVGNGRATLVLNAPGHARARATKAGYTPAAA